jgi:uncharacterized protein YceK
MINRTIIMTLGGQWRLGFALAFLGLCGCGTVSTRAKGLGGPYSGLSHDLEKIGSAEEWSDASITGNASGVPFFLPRGLLWGLDAPFSLVGDTLCLPVDWLHPKYGPPSQHADSETDNPAKR